MHALHVPAHVSLLIWRYTLRHRLLPVALSTLALDGRGVGIDIANILLRWALYNFTCKFRSIGDGGIYIYRHQWGGAPRWRKRHPLFRRVYLLSRVLFKFTHRRRFIQNLFSFFLLLHAILCSLLITKARKKISLPTQCSLYIRCIELLLRNISLWNFRQVSIHIRYAIVYPESWVQQK